MENRESSAHNTGVSALSSAVAIPDSRFPIPGRRPRFALIAARSLYRPTRDGQRLIVLQTLGREAIPPATVVLNWTSVLK